MTRFYQMIFGFFIFLFCQTHIQSRQLEPVEGEQSELLAFMNFLEWDLTEAKIFRVEKRELYEQAWRGYCQLSQSEFGIALLSSHSDPLAITARINAYHKNTKGEEQLNVCEDFQALPRTAAKHAKKSPGIVIWHWSTLVEAIKRRQYSRALQVLREQVAHEPKLKNLYLSIQKVYAGSQKGAGQVGLDSI